jgi:energy-coupling factor transport system ATP-binding protein
MIEQLIAPNVESLVQLRDVSFRYPDGDYAALDHQHWDIDAGELALVVGRSGSGKSTLLRALNGLVPHFSGGRFGGTVTVCGLPTRRHGPNRLSSHVGFVFQDPETQVLGSRVDEDIAFSLEQHGVSRSTMRKRVEELLDLLSIEALRHRDPSTLSGGERQRVAIAGALALHPDLLVLDEPTSQLDPWGAEDVLTALTRLNEDLGLTVVVAEHRLERLLHRVDRVFEVDSGGLSAGATPREYARQANPIGLPPVTQVGAALEWDPVPLTVKEGRQAARGLVLPDPPGGIDWVNGDTVLEASRLTLRHGQQTILRDVDVTLREGELLAVIGRNGSGKTTLIRSLLGHHPITSGEVRFPGVDVDDRNSASLGRHIGYLPQQAGTMFFAEQIRDEIAFTARNRGTRSDEAEIDRILDRVGLAGFGDRHPRDLSGGEQERLALAIMLTGDPVALMLDEPTRGMDAWRRADLVRILEDYRRRGGAVLMATHDVELVAKTADRVVMLGDGETIVEGTPEEVLGGSLTFTTQTQLVFGQDWLTPAVVVNALTPR